MYNNLTKEDILSIINRVNISDYYKKKLRGITNEKKLQKEFSHMLERYDKFIKQKKYITKLLRKRNKLKRKKVKNIQKGGGTSEQLQNIILELDSLKFNNNYTQQLNDLEKNINQLSERKVHKEYQKLFDKIIKEQEVKAEQVEKAIQNEPLSPDSIRLLKEQKEKLENEIKQLKEISINERRSAEKALEQQKIIVNNYEEQLQQLQKLSQENRVKLDTIEAQKIENQKNMELKIAQLKNENDLSKNEINKLNAQIKQCNNKKEELLNQQTDIQQCQVKVKEQEEKILDLQTNVDDYDKKLEKVNKEKQELQNKKLEIDQKMEKIQNEIIKEKSKPPQHDEKEIKESLNDEKDQVQDQEQKEFDNFDVVPFVKRSKPLEDFSKEMENLKEQKQNIDKKIDENEKLEEEIIEDKQEDNKELEKELEDLEKPKEELSDEEAEEDIKEMEKQIDNEDNQKKLDSNDRIILKLNQQLKNAKTDKRKKLIKRKIVNMIKAKKALKQAESKQVKLKPLNIPKKDESDELKKNNYSQYLLNKSDNIVETIKHMEQNNVDKDKIKQFGYKQVEELENETKKLDNETSNIYSGIANNWNKFLKFVKENKEKNILNKMEIISDDKPGAMFGGGKKRKFYGGSIIDLKTKLNFNKSIISKKSQNYNFIKTIENNMNTHINNYVQLLDIQPQKILKRLSKGVVILYLRLIEDVFIKWENLGWMKITDDFFKLDFDKIQQGSNIEIKKMNTKIKELSGTYRSPKFESSEYNEKIMIMLKDMWNQYYLILRRWFNILKNLSKNLRGDQAIDIFNSNTEIQEFFNNFNILREKLDNYQILIRKPVSVYARINDIGRDNTGFKNTQQFCEPSKDDFVCKRVKKDDYVMFGIYDNPQYENFLNLNINQCSSIQKLKQDKPQLFKRFNRFSQLENATKFDEIFFSAEFSNNNTISRYMLLDKLLSTGIGVFLVTYGYSGVGKSFTLFGSPTMPGLLQSTISNIFNIKKTKFRIYEIYGLGLPYSDGYKNLSEINQELIHYNMKISDTTKAITLEEQTTKNFNDIGKYIGNNSKELFLELPKDKKDLIKALNSISKLVEKIDIERRTAVPARVKPTVNNPDSSRSILIYDFIFTIELDNGETKEVSFVIDDMPGLEDPIKTYVIENKKKIIFKTMEQSEFDFYECEDQNQLQLLKQISSQRKKLMSNVTNFFEKHYFTEELNYIKNPIEYYQELLLMSVLINPLYVALLKPNDIFYYFNRQESIFRKLVLEDFNKELFEVDSNNRFIFYENNRFMNKLLNNKSSIKISVDTNYDRKISKSALELLKIIMIVSIETNNFDGLIDILSNILIDSKIPSNPTFNEEILLSEDEIQDIKKKFKRKILAKYLIGYLEKSKSAGVRLGVDKNKIGQYSRSKKRKVILEKSFMLGKSWKYLKGIVKKAKNENQVLETMLRSPVDKFVTISSNIKQKMRTKGGNKYDDYIEVLLEENEQIKESFNIAQKIKLYQKKQNIIYQDEDKMKKIVKSFVNIAFEAWYINQNIAGILKYYSVISNIDKDIIDTYVEKQDLDKTSLNNNVDMVTNHLNKLYNADGMLQNLEVNFYNIFCEIKRNTYSTRLFQTPEQENKNGLIVRDIIDPYIQTQPPRIQDFKMFYVLSNNSTQLKCLNQAELFLNTRSFINEIGKK